jgi:aminoglycoside 6'-N-acetyltransferase I
MELASLHQRHRAHKSLPHPSKQQNETEASQPVTVMIRQAEASDQHELARMCELLWPESPREEHRNEVEIILHSGRYGTLPMAILVSQNDSGALTGFLEVGLRSHADGCDTAHPVGFIEGWFVDEASRKQGIGRALIRAAEHWASEQGCREIASDTWIDDQMSIDAHQALGFQIVDRCVHFRKPL